MNKKYILKSNRDFNRIIQTIKPFRYKYLSFYIEKTTKNKYFFGFSIGKKIGNAVIRNKIRRKIKVIISKYDYQKGFNCIIMVNSDILNKSFLEIEKDIFESLKNLNILKVAKK